MASLSANGVIVARSLEPALVRRLCQAFEPSREPVPLDGDGDEVESLVEPATLCARVRSLASEAHRTLTRTPCAPIEELDELRQQVANLQLQLDRFRRLQRCDSMNSSSGWRISRREFKTAIERLRPSAPAGRPAEHARPTGRWIAIRTATVMRWLHIYLAMFGLAAVLFFSVTGLTNGSVP